MELLINVEHRFRCTPDGAVWTRTQFPFAFWQRYLDVFQAVTIVARAESVATVPNDWQRVDGDRVRLHALADYLGLKKYLLRYRQVQRRIASAMQTPRAVILRVHSPIAIWMAKHLDRRSQPYAVEVVADPWDLFSPRAIRHPLRPWLRHHFSAALRGQCQGACASSYVTKAALQDRYPPHPHRFTTHYSSIELPAASIRSTPRTHDAKRPLRIITVGALSQMYKGVDVLLKACAICQRKGVAFNLTVVGDGQHRETLVEMARELDIGNRVEFLGSLPAGDAVTTQLDAADLFVLASRQEGLPRSMIEAMARGLPCLGTRVGGIPELLPDDECVETDDPESLATMISALANNPAKMDEMSCRNLRTAADYENDGLKSRRDQMYSELHEATRQWLSQTISQSNTMLTR